MLYFALLVVNFLQFVSSARILFVVPVSSISEARLFHPLAKSLSDRGHEITVVTSFLDREANFTQIVTVIPATLTDVIKNKSADLFEKRNLGKNQLKFILTYDESFMTDRCHSTYQNNEFQKKILTKNKGHFDVIILSAICHVCFFGLAHKFQSPMVLISPLPVPTIMSAISGFREPPSFVPLGLAVKATDRMTFSQRLINTIGIWALTTVEDLKMSPIHTEIYRKYLGEDYPSSLEIEKKHTSMILSNSHYSISKPRPWLPDVVGVGGMHCKPALPLPKHMQDFISKGKDGFIYYSMGTAVTGDFPENIRKIFLNVFSRLKQRVLWKWETEEMEDLPDNVMLSKWYPQQDILGHKDIRLFITHGGAFSTLESAYHGTPVIGLPIFLDQDFNMHHMEDAGFALVLELSELTEEIVEKSIHEVLQNPKFRENAKRISKIVRDHPVKPLDLAVYHVEYVIRYKGAPHLRSASRDLNFIQFHSYDVIFALLMGAILILVIALAIIVCVLRNVMFLLGQKKRKTDAVLAKKNR